MNTLRFETQSGSQEIGVLRVSRPEAMNALNSSVLSDLDAFLTQMEKAPQVRALVVTGDGEKSFVAGADIKEMESLNAAQAREMAVKGQALFQRLQDLRVPVVAALNGFTLGGGLELALACDFIVASNKAKWGLPEVTLGLIPGYGGTQRLSRAIGVSRARRVALSGEIFTAQQGYEWGLIAHVYEPDQLMSQAVALAQTLASRAPLAMAWVKDAINQGFDQSLKEGMSLEADLFSRTFETSDRSEGIQAFKGKRPPQFIGR